MPTSKTGSTCTPRTVQGTHVFDILGYSQLRGMGHDADKFVRSSTFAVGGYDWAIRFYPDGNVTKGSQDCMSVYLELLSKGAKVRASCDLRLVDQTTGLSSSVHKTEPRVFNSDDVSKYAPQTALFKKRSEFERSGYLRHDRLTIECIVTVIQEPQVCETKSSPRIEVPPSDIAAHLGKLLEEKEGADVTFGVGAEIFAAHKVVLAMRSPVFKAELFGPMRETGTQHIKIEGMQPDVFKALLQFIYTDSLPAIDDLEGEDKREMIRHILVAADRYAMERLKLMCESILCENLDVQTVATTLALADQHHCEKLKDACTEFISSSNTMDDVVATQGYVDLKRTGPSILVDLLEKIRLRKT